MVILEADGLTAGPRPVPVASRGDLCRGPFPRGAPPAPGSRSRHGASAVC